MRILLVVLTFISSCAFGQIPLLSELIAKTDPAVVKVYVLDQRGEPVSQGSGVAITSNGVFITNFHVLEGARQAVIVTHEGKKYDVAKILDYSADKDLIKFAVASNGGLFKSVEINTTFPLKGSNVFSLGYPNGFLMEGESTVSVGIISGSRKEGDNKLIQTTTPITHGSSGGGLFDDKGRLVGITTGTFAGNVEDLHANMNKVVPAYEINTLTQKYNWTLEDFYINTKDLTCYLTGLNLYYMQDYTQAYSVFNKCLEQRKYDPHIFYLMGTCLFHIGRGGTSEGYAKPDKEILTRALDFYKAALELEQDYVSVFCYSSMILEYLGDFENAFTLSQKAYELNPKSPFSNYAIAKQYANRKDWVNAIKFMSSAISLAQSQGNNSAYLHQYYLELAIFYEYEDDQKSADNHYKRCLELNPENLDALFWYGNFLAKNERNQEACKYLAQLQSLSPNFAIGPNSVKRMLEELKCENSDRTSIKEVKIGEEIWMAENLSVDHFRNGDPIVQAKTVNEWEKANREGTPVWCYYGFDESNSFMGKLYNYYAVSDKRSLAPEGWYIASRTLWQKLAKDLNEDSVAMKIKSRTRWEGITIIGGKTISTNGTNTVGFNAYPNGYIYFFEGNSGNQTGFLNKGEAAYWWTSNPYDEEKAYFIGLDTYDVNLDEGKCSKMFGLAIRCVKVKSITNIQNALDY